MELKSDENLLTLEELLKN